MDNKTVFDVESNLDEKEEKIRFDSTKTFCGTFWKCIQICYICFFAIIVIISLNLIVASFLLLTGLSIEQDQAHSTEENLVYAFARKMNASLDVRADPCVDFYQYACGNSANSFFDGDGEFYRPLLVKDAIRRDLDFAYRSTKPAQSVAIQFSRDLYAKCLNFSSNQVAANSSDSLRFSISRLIGKPWPLLSSNSERLTRSSPRRQEEMLHLFAKLILLDSNILLNMTILTSRGPPSTNQSKLVLIQKPRREMFQPLRRGLIYRLKSYLLLNRSLPQVVVNETFLQMGIFERKLYRATERKPVFDARVTTFGALKRALKNRFDWTKLANRISILSNSTYRFGDSDRIAVPDLAYVRLVTRLLRRTGSRVVKNYLMWRFAAQQMKLLDDLSCVDLFISEPFNAISLRVYLAYISQGNQALIDTIYRDVRQIAGFVFEAIREQILANHSSFDSATRARAIGKLFSISVSIGAPHWIRTETDQEVDQRFAFVNSTNLAIEHDQFLPNYFRWIEMWNSIPWKFFPRQETQSWQSETPLTFEPSLELGTQGYVLKVPFTVFRSPYYDVNFPAAINYGALAFWMARELMHAFDSTNFFFDIHTAEGRSRAYLMPSVYGESESARIFYERAQCFKKQYGRVVDSITGLKLNSNFTRDEDIADNGAIRAALLALIDYLDFEPQSSLPLPEKFGRNVTYRKLFFISFAQTFCAKISPDTARASIESGRYTLPQHRVNIALRNLIQFSDEFACSAEIQTSSDEFSRCRLW